MNKERLDEIEKLAEAATPGPWEACGCRFSIVTTKISPQESMDVCDTKINDAISCEQAERNNYFIAAARTAVPELLEAVRERDAEIADTSKMLANVRADLFSTMDEMKALRSRCEKLEAIGRLLVVDRKLMDDTEDLHVFEAAEARFSESMTALDAALAGARGK